MNRKNKELVVKSVICFAAAVTVFVLIVIVGFIVKNGIGVISLDYLLGDNNSVTQYVTLNYEGKDSQEEKSNSQQIFIEKYGIGLILKETDGDEISCLVSSISKDSPAKKAINAANDIYTIKVNDEIKKIGKYNVKDLEIEQIEDAFTEGDSIRIKITRPGGGIFPMIVATVMLILLSLVIAVPIGVFAAIYLEECAAEKSNSSKFQRSLLNAIKFATEVLAGIPSIVYGLFGMLFFVKFLGIGQSVVSGSLTLGIILLPTIIRTTQEALKTIPLSYKEGSYALGANKLQTLQKVVIPNAISGILVAVILAIGRIVGESAALLFTMGTFAKIPKSFMDSGATLTVRAYMEVKEYANIEMACGIGVVLLFIVFILNMITKFIGWKLSKWEVR